MVDVGIVVGEDSCKRVAVAVFVDATVGSVASERIASVVDIVSVGKRVVAGVGRDVGLVASAHPVRSPPSSQTPSGAVDRDFGVEFPYIATVGLVAPETTLEIQVVVQAHPAVVRRFVGAVDLIVDCEHFVCFVVLVVALVVFGVSVVGIVVQVAFPVDSAAFGVFVVGEI